MIDFMLLTIRHALCLKLFALRHMINALRRLLAAPYLALAATLIICTVFLSSNAFAAIAYYQWSAGVGISQQYDNNLNLEETDKEDDWITLIGPSLTFEIRTKETEAVLAYDLRYANYLRNSDNNTFRHSLTLSGLEGIHLSEKVTLDLIENLEISEDPLEVSEQVTSTRRSRDRYYRNEAGARINYQVGERDSVYAGFNHLLLINKDSNVADSQSFEPSARIEYWLNIRNGISLDYSYTRGVIDGPEDFDEHYATTTYTHRFSPRTQADLTYTYDRFDYKTEGDVTLADDETTLEQRDYVVHTGTLGLRQQFTQNFSGTITGGYYFWDRDNGDDESQFIGDAALNGSFRLERGSISLRSSTGYQQQFFEAENLGFTRYYRVSGNFTYQFLEKLTTSLSAFYWRDEYKETTTNREDNTWGGRVAFEYEFSRWLTLSAGYDYRERDSTDNDNDYHDQRFTINLNLQKAFVYVSKPKPI